MLAGQHGPVGTDVHISKAASDADWDALNPNSQETECRACGAYHTKELKNGEEELRKLTCPEFGSGNHGGVGSPAGGHHVAMHHPRLPWPSPTSPLTLEIVFITVSDCFYFISLREGHILTANSRLLQALIIPTYSALNY